MNASPSAGASVRASAPAARRACGAGSRPSPRPRRARRAGGGRPHSSPARIMCASSTVRSRASLQVAPHTRIASGRRSPSTSAGGRAARGAPQARAAPAAGDRGGLRRVGLERHHGDVDQRPTQASGSCAQAWAASRTAWLGRGRQDAVDAGARSARPPRAARRTPAGRSARATSAARGPRSSPAGPGSISGRRWWMPS